MSTSVPCAQSAKTRLIDKARGLCTPNFSAFSVPLRHVACEWLRKPVQLLWCRLLSETHTHIYALTTYQRDVSIVNVFEDVEQKKAHAACLKLHVRRASDTTPASEPARPKDKEITVQPSACTRSRCSNFVSQKHPTPCVERR